MKRASKIQQREKRHRRIRAKIFGTKNRPRLSVYRSNKFTYAQLINDDKGETLMAADDREIPGKITKTERAARIGQILAKEALAKKIKKAVFDRGGFRYGGRIKALAEAARKAGLEF